jgi:uncharacterized protein (DUF1499 family)
MYMSYFYKNLKSFQISSLALWSRRIALFAFVIAAFGIYLARSGKVPFIQAISVLGSAFFLSMIAIICAVFSFIIIWKTGISGLKSAYLGFFSSILLLIYPIYLVLKAFSLPILNDVTTDFNDPPNSIVSIYNADFASYQRKAYPDIQPIILDLNMQESMVIIQEAIKLNRISVLSISEFKMNITEANLIAIDYSYIMKMPEDVTIRLRSLGQETRIDIRSKSQIARHDFGSNATRIRSIIENIATIAKQR